MTERERRGPSIAGQVQYEHHHRYAFASDRIAGLKVLDLASGDGCGSAMLAAVASRVVGADPAPQAVEAAKAKYGQSDRLTFTVADFQHLPFEDGGFDAVVSFGTLDHVPDPDRLFVEIRRVLSASGFVIVSVPQTSPDAHDGFVELMRRHFSNLTVVGQRMAVSSLMSPVGPSRQGANLAEYRAYSAHDTTPHPAAIAAVPPMSDPDVLVCVASNASLPDLHGSHSVFLMDSPDLWSEHLAPSVSSLRLDGEADPLHAQSPDSLTMQHALELAEERVSSLLEARALLEREVDRLTAAQKGDVDLALVGPLMEDLAGAPITPDAPNLIRLLGQVAVRMATQDVHLSELGATRSRLVELQEAVNERTLERQRLLENLDAAKRTNSELESHAAHLTAQADETQRDLAEAIRGRDQVRQIADQAEAELSAALASLVEFKQDEQNNITLLEQKIHDLREETSAATARIAEHQLELYDTRAELVRAQQTAAETAQQHEEASLKLEALAAREAALSASLEEASARIKILASAPKDQPQTQPQPQASSAVAPVSLTPAPSPQTGKPAARPRDMRRLAGRAFANAIRARKAETLMESAATQRQAIDAIDTLLHVRDRVHGALANASEAFNGLGLPVSSISAKASPEAELPSAKTAKRGWKSELRHLVAPQVGRSKVAHRRDARLSDDLLRAVFDPTHYVYANKVTLAEGQDPLDHYMSHGRAQGWSPHPLIDIGWIAAQRPAGAKFDLVEYLTDAGLFSLAPHPLFDAAYYLSRNEDLVRANVNPLAHYLLHGWREGRAPNRLFDNAWYLLNNPDALVEQVNPLVHLARFGLSNQSPIHPLFDRAYYLDRYRDVAAGGMDAYVHYIAFGQAEGRIPSADLAEATRLQPFFTFESPIDTLVAPNANVRLKRDDGNLWPPAWNGSYWLPQKLRDLIIARYGEAVLGLYTHLFSVIERYADAPETFDDSADCKALAARAQNLAQVDLEGVAPTVSIIVPVYNNLLYTLTSIVSVLETTPNYSFEIIVGDDGSTDATAAVIKSIGGVVHYHKNPKNLGFLKNCNAAAQGATGEFVLFLNNDTIAMPDWLDQLIAPFEKDPTIGFTGSKLLNGDGTLQEAGGVFWEDGSAWNFGRNSDPMLPEFNYLKDVDYVSGAAIAIPMDLWQRLGGFDPLYSPAYCEDADIAFRIRDLGRRTVYAPHSVIVHHEGRSHGRDLNSGIKAYQVINQKKFFERFQDTLARENFPNAQEVFLARDRSRSRPHILIVDHYVPQWDQDAGSRSTFHFIRTFVNRGFQVTFWPDNLNEDRAYAEELQRMGVEVIYGPSYAGKFDSWLSDNGRYFDYALLCRPHISERYIDTINQAGIKCIYYGHDLHCMRARSAYQATRNVEFLLEADDWESRELAVSLKSNVVMYPGLEEIEYMSARLPKTVSLVRPPIIMYGDAEFDAAEATIEQPNLVDPYALMFVGGFSHTPNGDGITWFLDEIWPLLRAADSRFTLRVAGSKMPASLKRRRDPGVEFLGRVSDAELLKMYETSGASIVPLRFGGGVKGKVVEAFAYGVPVVMTEVGAQGLVGAEDFSYVSPADHRFATAVIAAASDRQEALARARKAVDFLRINYSEQAFCDLLAADVPELASPRPRPV